MPIVVSATSLSTDGTTAAPLHNTSSNSTHPEVLQMHTVAAAVLTIVYALSLLVNSLAAYTIVCTPSMRNQSMHILLTAFSSNCLCIVMAGSLNITASWYGSVNLPLLACHWYVFWVSFLGLLHINLLCVLAVLRCRLVLRNQAVPASLTPLLICCAALPAVLWSLPPIISNTGIVRANNGAVCDLNWESSADADRIYMLALLCFEFCTPLVVMMTSYLLIFAFLRKQRQTALLANSDRTERREVKLLIHVIAIFAAFAICWTPYCVLALISFTQRRHLLQERSLAVAATVTMVLAKTGMGAAAGMYFVVSSDFRNAFAKTRIGSWVCKLCCKCCFASAEEDNLGQTVRLNTLHRNYDRNNSESE